MTKRRSLPTLASTPTGLGLSTIMDPHLAATHGPAYIRLAALAIDLDRIRIETEDEEDPRWPFGWEVFLTEAYLLQHFDPDDERQRALIEDAFLSVQALGPGYLGGQVPFAIYDAVQRGVWPTSLQKLWRSWRNPPIALARELEPLWAEAITQGCELIALCEQFPLDPPLAPTTAAALVDMALAETWPKRE